MFPEEIMFVNYIIWTKWENTDKTQIPTVWAITYMSCHFTIFFKEDSKTPFLKITDSFFVFLALSNTLFADFFGLNLKRRRVQNSS